MKTRQPVRQEHMNIDMIVVGIDIGSLSTEAIVFDKEKGILGCSWGSLGATLLAVNGF